MAVVAPPSTVMAGNKLLALKPGIRYRREAAGCLVFDPDDLSTRFYNEDAAKILEFFSRPARRHDIVHGLLARDSRATPSVVVDFVECLVQDGLLVDASTQGPPVRLFLNETTASQLSAPLGIELELTLRCLRQCAYCAYESHPRVSTTGELSCSDWKRVINTAVGGGVFYIRFTGGDPLSRVDAPLIIAHADATGVGVSVASDLTSLTEELVDFLAQLKSLVWLQTTLDGPNPAIADQFRGNGSYSRVTRGLKQLAAASVPIMVGTIVTRLNAHHVYATAQRLAEIGEFAYAVSPLYVAGRGRSLSSLVPTSEDLSVAQDQFADAVSHNLVSSADPAWQMRALPMSLADRHDLWTDQPYLVRSPDRLMRIDPTGRMYCSIQLKEHIGDEVYVGNVATDDPIRLWRDAPLFRRLRMESSQHAYFGPVLDVRSLKG